MALEEELDQYTVEQLEAAIKRCDDNIAIFTAEIEKHSKQKMEFQLLLMQKQKE